MKNYIKKLITLFVFAFLFTGSSVLASGGIWNTGPAGSECPDINISNASTGQGGLSGYCWTGVNINANPGDTVRVKIYYHNAGSVTATDTHIKVTAPTSSSTYQSFYGQIVSPQGNLPSGPVSASISTAQTLTYSSTTWYIQNSSGTLVATPLLNGQNGSEVIGPNGLYIGNIVPGWANTQGAVVVNFTVSSTTPPPPLICSITNFSANPLQVNPGSSFTLNWNTSNCNNVSVSGSNFNSSSFNGPQNVIAPNISGSYKYSISASGTNGSATPQDIYISVNSLLTTGTLNASPNYCTIQIGSSNCTIPFNWTTNNPPAGATSSVTYNLNNQSIIAATANNSSQSFSIPYGSSIYYLYNNSLLLAQTTVSASCVSGSTWSGSSCTQNISNTCNLSTPFTANGSTSTTIQSGNAVILNWGTSGNNCSVNVTGPNFNSSSQNGPQTIYPTSSGTYTLNMYGSTSGTQTQTVYVNVNSYQNNYNNCAVSYFTASPTSVNYGGASTLSWSTNNCNSVSISNIGSVNSYGSQIVYPTYTTTYVLTAYGSNGNYYSGNQTQSVTVSVNNYVPPVTPIYNTCAVTGVATNVSQNSVTLNGIISNPTAYSSSTYFEYGRTVSLGSQTVTRIANASSFSEVLTGLSPNTIYYYRLVSNCGNGTSQGSIEIFQTASNQTSTNTTTIIRQGTTVIGTESPIMLKIENRYQSFKVGDSVDYTITYKNISSRTLTHPILQVILPKGVTYLNSSRGTYVSDTYTLTVSLEDLVPNVEGVVYVQGRVDSIDSGNAQIVTTALLVYTARNGAQENAMAYVLNNPVGSVGFGLGAAALFGGMFGMGIIGWLIILILVLLAILLFRKVYRRQN